MIYIKLFYNFIIVGLFSFGGAYSAIPLVKDVGERFDVLTPEMLSDFIAIAESTPGPVGVNLATFVGSAVAGVFGAIVATMAEVLPAFIIILLFTIYFKKFIYRARVKFVLSVIRPCVIGIITSVGVYMLFDNIGVIYSLKNGVLYSDFNKTIIISLVIVLLIIIYKKLTKRSLGGINIILLGAILGIAINSLL